MDLRPQSDAIRQTPTRDGAHASAGGGDATAPSTVPTFDVGRLLARTWSIYKARYPTITGWYWGAGAANLMSILTLDLVLSGLSELAQDPIFFELLRFVHFMAFWVVPAWLWIGQSLALLKIARGEPVTLEDLFRGGPYLLTTLLATIILLAGAAVPFLLVQVLTSLTMIRFEQARLDPLVVRLWESCLGGNPVLPTLIELGENWITWLVIGLVGTGLSVLAVFPVLVRLGQYSYAIIDLGLGVFGSHGASWRMTRGQVATVSLVYLAYVTINLAGLFLFCAGLFLTLPWTNLLLAVTYDALSEASGLGESYPDAEA